MSTRILATALFTAVTLSGRATLASPLRKDVSRLATASAPQRNNVTRLTIASSRGAETAPGYSGIEFYGSSQVTRAELEKDANIKPGAELQGVEKGAQRLRDKLDRRNLRANVGIAREPDGRLFLTVDVEDNDVSGVPVRKMVSAHRVNINNELVFDIRRQLSDRLIKLIEENRPVSTNIDDDGTLSYSDEPCNQFAKKLRVLVPPQRAQLLELIANDPDPNRRGEAVALLNWDSQALRNCLDLAPAIDDGAFHVRAMADQYIIPRLKFLPDNFPIQELIEVFSHQLARPAHSDRVQALKALTTIAAAHPFTLGTIRAANEERLKQLQSQSVLTTIKGPAAQLLEAFNRIPPPPKSRNSNQLNEF